MTGEVIIRDNGQVIFNELTNLTDLRALIMNGSLNANNTFFDVRELCIYSCDTQRNDCEELTIDGDGFTWNQINTTGSQYEFTLLTSDETDRAQNIQWNIDNGEFTTATNDRSTTLSFPESSGTYRVCVRFEIETADGIKCYIICREICIFDPFDPDNCAPISFFYIGAVSYTHLTLPTIYSV